MQIQQAKSDPHGVLPTAKETVCIGEAMNTELGA
jgi:hypothetical protein